MAPIDSVATMQARMTQIQALVVPGKATIKSSALGASAAGTGTSFAASLESATGMFGSGATTDTSFASGLESLLASLNFASGAADASSLGSVADGRGSASGATGQDLVDAARKYTGVPYVYGGDSLAEGGLDCSGLVQRSFADLGVTDIPRVARDQGTIGTAVKSLADARPGDLLIFDGGTHIGIYVGDGQMIDAPVPGKSVSQRAVYETPTSIRRVLAAA